MRLCLLSVLILSLTSPSGAAIDDGLWPVALGPVPRISLHLNHSRALLENLDRFATEAALRDLDLRPQFARWFYGCEHLDGLDLGQPAHVYWRGDGRVLAVLPLADRARFMADFQALPLTSTGLVRIGEQQGTLVYAFNGEDAIHEYRLLIRDRRAYLAASLEECELLAAHDWPHLSGAESPISYRQEQPRLAGSEAVRPLARSLPEPWRAALVAALSERLAALLEDCAAIECTVTIDRAQRWRFVARYIAQENAPTARWLTTQRDQASRLAPLLDQVVEQRPLVRVQGDVRWGGALLAAGKAVLASIRSQLPASWLPTEHNLAIEDWLLRVDGRRAFAWSLLAEPGLRFLRIEQHDDVQALVHARDRLAFAFQAPLAAAGIILSSDDGSEQHAGQPRHWLQFHEDEALRAAQTGIVTQRHLVEVLDIGEAVTGRKDANGIVAVLADAVTVLRPPRGVSAMLAASLALDRLLALGTTPVPTPLPPVDLSLALTQGAPGVADITAMLDVSALAASLRARGLGQAGLQDLLLLRAP